jgi:4,5-DOPA dioxygenase extradiol
MTAPVRHPALFVGHGSPMNALEDNAFTRNWRRVGAELPRPRAILAASAHWETRGTAVGANLRPETIHDFYGFPQALFEVEYRAPGDPALAHRVAQLIDAGSTTLDRARGLDHGIWSVLCAMYPEADIPVVPLSLDMSQPPAAHYRLAQRLAPLREAGVLILGSGNIVHNLREFSFRDPRPLDWAVRADRSIRDHVERGEHAALTDWQTLGADVQRGIAGPEHLLPLLYVLAQQQPDDALHTFNDVVLGSIAMTSFQIG